MIMSTVMLGTGQRIKIQFSICVFRFLFSWNRTTYCSHNSSYKGECGSKINVCVIIYAIEKLETLYTPDKTA